MIKLCNYTGHPGLLYSIQSRYNSAAVKEEADGSSYIWVSEEDYARYENAEERIHSTMGGEDEDILNDYN